MKTLFAAMARSVNSPRVSSMGRLFDGVAALVGLPQIISFEGEAAMALEFAADESYGRRLCVAAHSRHAACRRLGAAGPRRAGRSRRGRPYRPHQRPLPQRPGRTGPGDGPTGRRPSGGPQLAAAFKTHG